MSLGTTDSDTATMVWQLNRNKNIPEDEVLMSVYSNHSEASTQELIAVKSIFKIWFNLNK